MRTETFHGAVRVGLIYSGIFSVPIATVKCPKCPAASSAEYIAWSGADAAEVDRGEAAVLLTELVEADHPHHRVAVYGPAMLSELRERVKARRMRRAAAGQSG